MGGIDKLAERASIGAAAEQGTRKLGRVGFDAAIDSGGDVREHDARVNGIVEMLRERLCGAVGSEQPFTTVWRIGGGHVK